MNAYSRITRAARQWSEHTALTHGQQAMARALERHAARLAEEPAASKQDIDDAKLMCCYLHTAMQGGVKPDPARCSVGFCTDSSA